MEKYIGIIGGSGLYSMDGLEIEEERVVTTPYGEPSDNLIIGRLGGVPVVFLPRHGRGHRLNPTEVNYRANIYALKSIGVDKIIAVSAVGSMKIEHDRGHIILVDQFIDRTRSRPYTFFEKGIVAHVSFAHPVCKDLSSILFNAGETAGATIKNGGTYVCIEGPMFSSCAESELFRTWGVDVIGMTNYQEAKLAREAEICFSTMAMVTDYDCWHETEEEVDALSVVKVMQENVNMAKKIIKEAIPEIASQRETCTCNEALKYAIMTDKKIISAEAKERLKPIIGRYLK